MGFWKLIKETSIKRYRAGSYGKFLSHLGGIPPELSEILPRRAGSLFT